VSEAVVHRAIATARGSIAPGAVAAARPTPDAAAVRAALAEVPDPEIPVVSIVDLGMVEDVRVVDDTIRVTLLPTFVGCPALEVIRATVDERLGTFGRPVDVRFEYRVPWTSDRITREGREKLRASVSRHHPKSARRAHPRPAWDPGRLSELRIAPDRPGERIRPDAMSRDLPLHGLPPAVRELQADLIVERIVVGVVGAGTMGAGIAQLAVENGHEVVLHDVDEAAIERGRARVREGLARRALRLDLDGDSADEWVDGRLASLRDASSLDAVGAEAELVIEAALEDLELKRAIFRTLDEAAGPDVVLATNTSALSVAAIAEATRHPHA
jgi:metal-sulfur cluster biosynthetic enzyme